MQGAFLFNGSSLLKGWAGEVFHFTRFTEVRRWSFHCSMKFAVLSLVTSG